LILLPNRSILLCLLPDCLCTCKSCCVQGQDEQYCTLVQQTHLNCITGLHNLLPINPWLKSSIFMAEKKVNGGISFYLTEQENGMQRLTMSHNFFLIFTPVQATVSHIFVCNIYPCTSNKLTKVVLHSTVQLITNWHCTTAQCFIFI
jgi:hypothetical protein